MVAPLYRTMISNEKAQDIKRKKPGLRQAFLEFDSDRY
jgi:hypothetical protein